MAKMPDKLAKAHESRAFARQKVRGLQDQAALNEGKRVRTVDGRTIQRRKNDPVIRDERRQQRIGDGSGSYRNYADSVSRYENEHARKADSYIARQNKLHRLDKGVDRAANKYKRSYK